MKRILFLTRDGQCPIVAGADDKTALGAAEAFRYLNESAFELMAICSSEEELPLESIVRKASRKNPLMAIVVIGEREISDRIALSLVDAVIRQIQPELIEAELNRILATNRLLTDCELIGKSPEIKAIGEIIARVAPTGLPVLIVGESGTGKELVARAIHKHSARSGQSFLPINAAAIASGTLESELFGHERGAFTGATNLHRGFFEQADRGTLFLDEIAELPLPVQAKLLRVLETGDFMRVGSAQTIHTDVRLVCATNKDLISETLAREFRQDLYYRLAAVKIKLPPLRERPEDIPVLIYRFAQKFRAEGRNVAFSESAIAKMMDYHWPGNVRELRNLVENAVLLSRNELIFPEDIEPYFTEHEQFGRALPVIVERLAPEPQTLEKALALIYSEIVELRRQIEALRDDFKPQTSSDDFKKATILKALEKNAFNKNKTADALGISLRTLYRKLKKFSID